MADISKELQRIQAAVKGEDVRGSIHDAIDAINRQANAVEEAHNTEADRLDAAEAGIDEFKANFNALTPLN